MLAAIPGTADAQVQASELATLTQVIDGTKITITGSRPRGRERPVLFGTKDVVSWNEVWTPGANHSTTFEVTKPVKIDGQPLPAGKYSVWMVVRESGEWTLMFHTDTTLIHYKHPDSLAGLLRVPLHVQEAPYVDLLTWSIPEIRGEGCTVAMQWGTKRVSFRLDVPPSFSFTLREDDARPFIGRYEQTDTVKGKVTIDTVTIRFRNGGLQMLHGTKTESNSYLMPISNNLFTMAFLDKKGDVEEITGKQYTIEFISEKGQVVRYEGRDQADKLWETALRRP